MQQQSLAKWLKAMIIGMGLVGLAFYGAVVPILGNDIISRHSEYSDWYYPWLVFLWLTAVPCYIVLYLGWKVSKNIGRDNSFCTQNAVIMKIVSTLTAGDSLFFFIGNIVYWLMGFNHPSMVLASLVIVFIGIAMTVGAAVLSHLIMKAAKLKEENDLTI